MSAITAIKSSADGSILLGTDGAGIIRFDGTNFEEIVSTQKENHHVSSFSTFGDNLYFTSKYKGVFQLQDEKESCLIDTKGRLGEWENVIALKNGFFASTTRAIFFKDSNKTSLVKAFKTDFHISQSIQLNHLVILLTNQGNYIFNSDTKAIKPLKSWINGSSSIDKMAFGAINGNKIQLCNNQLTEWVEIIIGEKNNVFSLKEYSKPPILNPLEKIVSCALDPRESRTIFLTSENKIYLNTSKGLRKITANYNQELQKTHTIISDQNGEIWLISSMNGLYKISHEPFTKILLHPVYSLNNIMSLHRSDQFDILVSTGDDKTYVGNILHNENDFEIYNFRTNSFTETKDLVLLGTKEGMKKLDKKSKKISNYDIPTIGADAISYIKALDNFLYIGVAGKGLYKYEMITRKLTQLKLSKNSPDHYYTSQYSPILRKHFFGTNDGVLVEDLETGKFSKLKESSGSGSYHGVSIKDIFGTCWFTNEKGLTGILQNGEIVSLDNPEFFNSTLFYTLNSDNYGNLIIGTNKGLTILQVNEQGMVLNKNYYTGSSGFGGYETHMRSQFQDKNSIFVGTIEGLFLIDMDVLRNFPKPSSPSISPMNSEKVDYQHNSFAFEFHTNNPKIQHLQYTYRIIGYQNEWSDLSSVSKLYLSNLPNGEYILEVRSTYDGKIYSDIGEKAFTVTLPFWKTRWFIVSLILFIVLLNILIIQKRKTFDGGSFFRTKDMLVELNMTPSAIMFAFVAVVVSNNIGPLIDPEIPSMLGVTFISGFLLLSLFLIAKILDKRGDRSHFRILLITGYGIAVGQYLIGIYYSELNPFYVLPLAIAITLAAYVFERMKHVIIQNLILLVICSVMVIYMEETYFNKYLFLFLILISGLVSVFTTYLRYDSLERLIFVSGIVNQGNVQVVAFNDEGTITYVSENIQDILPTTHEELLNQKISYLNNFIPEEGGYRSIDLTKQFFDGQKYLSPIISSKNELIWVEWSCKVFSDKVKVILGQNVSDRKEIENTYELLVENAEDLIYQCDVNGVFQFVNNRTWDVLESTKEDLIGKSSLDFVHTDYRNEVYGHYRNHFEEQVNSSYFEFPIVSTSGKVRWIGQHVTSLFTTTDKKYLTGFLALARDITEKREHQRIIEEQKDDITASITYAQRIQLNLLPGIHQFSEAFDEHFVIYKPKDIVSGDFYWMQRINNKTIIALADCTGHGVPGAFMTLLGINILNSVVLENRITEPAQILNEIDKKLLQALPEQNGTDNVSDGMEMTICTIDHSNGILSYACAGSRFLIYENNSFNLYKGDVKHIGDTQFDDFRGFVTHFVQLENDSIVYLMTDGFQDQFGGLKNKKFSFRRLLEVFEANTRLPLFEQKNMIEDEFEKWKLGYDQTDDVTIIAIRGVKS
jgi:PAS domain S-box-containing protein